MRSELALPEDIFRLSELDSDVLDSSYRERMSELCLPKERDLSLSLKWRRQLERYSAVQKSKVSVDEAVGIEVARISKPLLLLLM